jgi:hypothetical protein
MSSIKQASSKHKKTLKNNSHHVLPQNGKWVVRSTGNKRATSVHDTQAAANQRSEVIIHSRDGRVRQRASYSPADELMLRIWKKTHEDYSKSKRA